MPRPICFRLLEHFARLAASRTFWTAGSNRPIRTAIMAITTSSSIRVKPRRASDLPGDMVYLLRGLGKRKVAGTEWPAGGGPWNSDAGGGIGPGGLMLAFTRGSTVRAAGLGKCGFFLVGGANGT